MLLYPEIHSGLRMSRRPHGGMEEKDMFSKMIGMSLVSAFLLSFCVSLSAGNDAEVEPVKFRRFFCWGCLRNEDEAKRFAEAGVTDILVNSRKQYDLAVKYGMTPHWRVFTPAGPHPQVMTPEETKYCDYIGGKDLDPKMPAAERSAILHARRRDVQYRYGGEPVAEIDVLASPIPCFISDEDLALTKEKLDKLMEGAPDGIAGMFLDYFGYMNHRGCYCPGCLAKYQAYLDGRKLEDTPENRTAFYREKIVEYYEKVIAYIKSRHPDYKITVHVYPDFRADPLYGNRIGADFCGQTVSWYFKFDEPKIRQYTDYVVTRAQDYHKGAEGIPFIGLNTNKDHSLGYKTPDEVEHDLRTILAAGGRTVMVCSGRDILAPGYFEVFRKYCGKK